MDKLHFKSNWKHDDESRGINYIYTFSREENGKLQEVGFADLYFIESYFYLTGFGQYSSLDSISGGAALTYEGFTSGNGKIKSSILKALNTKPIDLLYLEHLDIKKEFRSRGYGKRIMKLLIDRHYDEFSLFALTAAPIDPEDIPEPEEENDPKYTRARNKKIKRLISFYQKVGFRQITKPENQMFLCLK